MEAPESSKSHTHPSLRASVQACGVLKAGGALLGMKAVRGTFAKATTLHHTLQLSAAVSPCLPLSGTCLPLPCPFPRTLEGTSQCLPA
jgi:hypothetical protein